MKLNFKSNQGYILNLVKNEYFTLTNVDGMTAATSSISSLVVGGVDGDIINNIQAQPRTIILDLRINDYANVEDAKRAILSVVKLKQQITLQWQINNKSIEITGYVEAVNMPRWDNGVTMQITLHCAMPFWEDVDAVVRQINEALNLHYFTENGDMLYFTEAGRPLGEYDTSRTRKVNNAGDVATGLDIEILAYKTVTNPIIYDNNGNFFGIGYNNAEKKITMQQGDIIKISTHKGSKTVTLNGKSVIGYVKPYSTWLQLQTGENIFTINSSDTEFDNVTFSLSYKRLYI